MESLGSLVAFPSAGLFGLVGRALAAEANVAGFNLARVHFSLSNIHQYYNIMGNFSVAMQQCSSRDEDMCGSPEVSIVALHQIFGERWVRESVPHIQHTSMLAQMKAIPTMQQKHQQKNYTLLII